MTAKRIAPEHLIATAMADAMLAGIPEAKAFTDRAAFALGHRHRWVAPLCRRAFRRFGSSLTPAHYEALVEWIRADPGYRAAWQSMRVPRLAHWLPQPPAMAPRSGALAACALPALATPADLAAWFGITPRQLDWYANVHGINSAADGPLCHYRYAWISKSHGLRLVEMPKPKLREMQRKILQEILDPIAPHRAAHGFRRGHSCRTFVAPHVGRTIVLRMDLRNFFASIPAPRIHAMFATLGYPAAVARILAGLCTNRVPLRIARDGASCWLEAKRMEVPHLPQGAPTSPALANLCALHLDMRVGGLAECVEASYTRYADDLAISGDEHLRQRVDRVARLVCAIALEEGFEVNHRKTRAMHRSRRQVLTGIVVNAKPNIRREEFDRLKAILTNCARHGPSSQNREARRDFRAHLAGCIAHVRQVNADRALKLEAIFRRIAWNDETLHVRQ